MRFHRPSRVVVTAGVFIAFLARMSTGLAQALPPPPPPPPVRALAAPPPPPPPPPARELAPPPPPPPDVASSAPPVPEGPAPTRASFTSTTAEQWDVLVDNNPVCATPCSGPLFPLQFVVLQSQDPDHVQLEVGRLPPGELVVSGKPLQGGMYAGGIVATTLGGMALAVGITLTAVGLAKDKGGMTTAGLITGGVGLLAVPGGIYLMVKALPSARVERAGVALSGLAGGIAGTF
jgi:hypothetical protein